MNKKTSVLIKCLLAAIFAAGLGIYFFTANNAAAAYCNSNLTASWVTTGGPGQPAVMSVTNSASCTAQVTAATWQVFVQPYQTGWNDQTLIERRVVEIGANQTQQISINTLGCLTQIDLYRGNGISNDIMLGDFSKDTNLCVRKYVTISGRVYKSTGEGIGNVTMEICDVNGQLVTDSGGYWSKSVPEGRAFCVRAIAGIPSNAISVNALNNQSCHSGNTTYEFQSAGLNRFESCTYNDERGWDLNRDTGLDIVVNMPNVCQNQCSSVGQRQCSGNGYQICYLDPNGCYLWGSVINCPSNQTCVNNYCTGTCTNDCSANDRRCNGNGYQICKLGTDGCYHWGSTVNCALNQTCVNDYCTDDCTNECTLNDFECSGSRGRICGKFGNKCTSWGSYTNCNSRCYSCGNNRCDSDCGETNATCPQDCGYDNPTVNLTSSGAGTCGQRITLSWNSTNATRCTASGSWSGSKSTSGSETISGFTGTRTFTLTCYNNSNDSAVNDVTVSAAGNTPIANAGSDRDINNNDSVILDGSIQNDADNTTYYWNCTGGTLSDYNVLRPTFYAPPYVYSSYNSWDNNNYDNYNNYNYRNYDRNYTCTLTARNDCGSDSDSVNIRVFENENSNFNVALTSNPNSGCAPLNDVDLTASLNNYSYYGSNGYNPNYTYYFDCQNDGTWEKTITSSSTSYTAYDLCDYYQTGNYTARVRVENGSRQAVDTHIINVTNCQNPVNGTLTVEKYVRNLSDGTQYQSVIAANPGEIVNYKIVVRANSGDQNNVTISDIIPGNLLNIRDVQIDGIAQASNPSSLNLGYIGQNQSKTITFTATVAPNESFSYGQTTITNTVTASGGSTSNTASATINVYRSGIKGATYISTGFKNNPLTDSLLIPLAVLIFASTAAYIKIKSKKDPRQQLKGKIAYIKENQLDR